MDKRQRKSDIGYMSVVAGMANQVIEKPGIISVGQHRDFRRIPEIIYKPGVFMQPKAFYEYFGEDTNFEYVRDHTDDWMEIRAEVNGVIFYAQVNSMDVIRDGKLVVV